MKIASFTHAGQAAYGLVDGDRYRLPAEDFAARYPDLVSVLRGDALRAFADSVDAAGRSIAKADTTALPVVTNPGKFICVGLNYKTHVAETKRGDSPYPSLFLRFNDTLAADGDEVPKPDFSERLDWEGELAFVIGKGGRHIAKADAYDHVAGYCCLNDVSVRDWQRHTHQFTPGKNFPGTAPCGPYLLTADEVPDVTQLAIETRVNGETVQKATLADLIFDIPTVIEYVSRFTPLSPGDLIATGTPGGVGDRREPPLYMKVGDTVEVEITKLGTLTNHIGSDR